jgi:hypothetical protein
MIEALLTQFVASLKRSRKRRRRRKKKVLMLVHFESLIITRVGDYCDVDVTIVASPHSSVAYC